MTRAALLLALLAGCGAFHRSDTVKAGKDAIKALPDLVAETRATNAKLGRLADSFDSKAVPAVVRTADSATRLFDWTYWALYVGVGGGFFSLFKSVAWRPLMRLMGWQKRRKARRAAKP